MNERLAIAVHEAGHYVAARGVGIQPEGCRLYDDGGVTLLRREDRSPTTADARRKLLVCMFGGMLAEHRWFGYMPLERGHEQDHRTATRLLMQWPTQAERYREQSEAMAAASRHLHERWLFLRALARELAECGRWGTSSTGRVPCCARGGPVPRRLPSAVRASRLELGGGLGLSGRRPSPNPTMGEPRDRGRWGRW